VDGKLVDLFLFLLANCEPQTRPKCRSEVHRFSVGDSPELRQKQSEWSHLGRRRSDGRPIGHSPPATATGHFWSLLVAFGHFWAAGKRARAGEMWPDLRVAPPPFARRTLATACGPVRALSARATAQRRPVAQVHFHLGGELWLFGSPATEQRPPSRAEWPELSAES